ncbi:MAG: hypothetical protein MUP17_10125, partial [candidate division Zixibacteria bacterium]|nr:hypothetical protein [candidate division Zixibacteria bacterium]
APECIDPKGNAPSLESFIAKAQAEITWKARELEIIEARKAGIREVVEWIERNTTVNIPNTEDYCKEWQAFKEKAKARFKTKARSKGEAQC